MILANLEFGVGNDDSAFEGVSSGAFVDPDGNVTNLRGQLFTDEFGDLLEADVLVMRAGFGFVRRRKQRLW